MITTTRAEARDAAVNLAKAQLRRTRLDLSPAAACRNALAILEAHQVIEDGERARYVADALAEFEAQP